jgi:hypothetical protein
MIDSTKIDSRANESNATGSSRTEERRIKSAEEKRIDSKAENANGGGKLAGTARKDGYDAPGEMRWQRQMGGYAPKKRHPYETLEESLERGKKALLNRNPHSPPDPPRTEEEIREFLKVMRSA